MVIPDAPCSMVICDPSSSGIPGDIAAALLSTPRWERSFYRGLLRPLLYLALRGGIAYRWGLRTGYVRDQEIHGYSPPKPARLRARRLSRPGSYTTKPSRREACYAVLWNFWGLYTSSERHIDKTMDAICRATVNLARFGFVPPSKSCW